MRTELKPGEKLVLIRKKHLFSLVPSACVLIIFIIAKQIGCDYAHQDRQICNLLLMITAIPGVYFIWKVADRFCERFVVTNFRLIHEYGVFTSNSKECPLDKINNTAFKQGFLGRIFGFGELEIQSAATFGAIYFDFLQSPKLFKDTVIRYQEVYQQLRVAEQAEALAKAIRGSLGPEIGPAIGAGIGVNQDTRECPHCAEIIKAKAKICRFCNNKLEPMMENHSSYNYVPRKDVDGKQNYMKENLPLTENHFPYNYVSVDDAEEKQDDIKERLPHDEQEKQVLKKTLISVFILVVVSFFVASLVRDILGSVGATLIQVGIVVYAFVQLFQVMDLSCRWTSEMLLKLLGVGVKKGEESLLTGMAKYIMLLVYLVFIYMFLFIPLVELARINYSLLRLLNFGIVILGLFFGYKIWEGWNKMLKGIQSNSSSLMQESQPNITTTAAGVCKCGHQNNPIDNFCVKCGVRIK